MALKISKNLIFYLTLLITCFCISCSDDEISETTPLYLDQNASQTSISNPPPGLPPGIPSYPYIFNGTFTINGEIGKNNSKIKAKLGELDSPTVISNNGEFKNLIIGPRNVDDIKNDIEFYLLLENGDFIKSKEEIPFEIVDGIFNKTIELNFED
jgi:hypothetical protein